MRVVVLTLTLLGACSSGVDEVVAFPEAYLQTYTQTRTCRSSTDHDLNKVRVLADPAALEPYMNRDNPFPVGSIVLKPEYDFTDTDCTGTPIEWTVMVKLASGSSPNTLDWHWQRVTADRTVQTDNEPRCYGCHAGCSTGSGGYDYTCTAP